MILVHGSISLWQLVVAGLFLFVVKCSAIDLQPLEQLLGQAVMTAMERSGLTVKAAAIIGGMDESTFRKALRGESYRHLTLLHMVKLGPLFMVHLSASLMWITAKQHAQEIVETVNVRKGA